MSAVVCPSSARSARLVGSAGIVSVYQPSRTGQGRIGNGWEWGRNEWEWGEPGRMEERVTAATEGGVNCAIVAVGQYAGALEDGS